MGQYLAKSGSASIMSMLPKDTHDLAMRFNSDIELANKRADVVSVSVFSGDMPASNIELDACIKPLQDIFKEKDESFWSTIKLVVRESGVSAKRLKYCVSQFLLTHTFGKSFTPAELLSFDKTITVARTQSALRSKVKYPLEYEDIVIIEFFNERRYALADEAKMYSLNVLGKLTSPYGTIEWVGTYDSEDFKRRRSEFGKEVGKYQDIYPKQMLYDFYYYWSQPIQCGDRMLMEDRWSQSRIEADGTHNNLIREYIEEWAHEHNIKPINNEDKNE